MVVVVEVREWGFIRHGVVGTKISHLLGQRYALFPPAVVVVFDNDLKLGQALSKCGFKAAKAEGLKPDRSIVKVLDRWLDKQEFHRGL
jgi:hypothetical protein